MFNVQAMSERTKMLTFASKFLERMPDLFALARITGHSHTRVTELYSHLLPDHLAATRNVVTYEVAAAVSLAKTTDVPRALKSNGR
ncbi:hypothetical protein AKJ09_04630 [Labilithrix luteola]|uniref:Uncharacterized protein n=2 Tax=Labilithrix luteola TaxID=1391654 RepID=A0A0K1PX53_9BACT|nr:hypothetical protein AKJ09_04630 [Labilithrix luteola]